MGRLLRRQMERLGLPESQRLGLVEFKTFKTGRFYLRYEKP